MPNYTSLNQTTKKKLPNLQLSGNKLIYHQKELRNWLSGEIFPPIFIEFGPTNACNHRCINCYVQSIAKKPISMKNDVYLRFMEGIGDYGVKAITLAGCGEPMLHRTTPEAIETAVNHGTDVGMFTNGVPITDNSIPQLMVNLTYISFTINGFSNKSHQAIHRGG